MTPNENYKVDYVDERTIITKRGDFEKVIQTGYSVPKLGAFTVDIPKAEFTTKKAKALIEKEVAEITGMIP